MCFRDIPKDLEDFNAKKRTWFGFDKAMKAIGLRSKEVLTRLKEGRPAVENVAKQNINRQKAHCKYVSGIDLEEYKEETKPAVLKPRGTQRTIQLTEKPKVILTGKPSRKTRSPNRIIRGKCKTKSTRRYP
jgi:hypothetical protein